MADRKATGARKRPRTSAHRVAPAIVHDAATYPCEPCKANRAKDHAPCLIGYARVSTDDQTQVDALEAAGCAQVYVDDGISGATTSRPELNKCLAALQPGDTLVVWRLDRLGRSMAHLVTTVEVLA